GLIANMVCGYIVMRKMYPAKQVVAVLMVTAGVIIATLASIGDASDKNAGMKPEPSEVPGSQSSDSLFGVHESAIGISLLTCGVFLAAMLGLYQETTYNKYGKHWKEGLFYNHALALPMFLLFRHDICNQIAAFSQSQPRSLSSIPIIGPQLAMRLGMFTVPSLWISLVANVLSQLVCVSGVHRLTSMSSSLTLNVVLNLRKLVSLVISVLLFKNAVNLSMLSGCALVFLGTFAYAQVGNGSGNGNKKKTDKDLKSSS
ncbi:golgi uridine diphosphate-N- acetylglucosamine transporter, partial [Dipsacomyces acuminosporus]